MVEQETETASISIRGSTFVVDNMSAVDFLDATGKSVVISDSDNHSRDVSYFNFRWSLNPITVDYQVPNIVHQFEFSLRLHYNSLSSSVNILLPSSSIVHIQLSVPTFNSTFSGISNNQLNKISETEIRDMLSAQPDSLFTSIPSNTSRSTTVVTTLTLK